MSVAPERSLLLTSILQVIQVAKEKAYRTSNAILLKMYWEIGRLIVEDSRKEKPGQAMVKKYLKIFRYSLRCSLEKALMNVILII